MPRSLNHAAVPSEDQSLDRVGKPRMATVRKLDRPSPARELPKGKAGFGAAVSIAIGDESTKAYGDESFIAKVKSGEKVPEYLARIYDNPDARRRLGLELLKDTGVTVRTVIEFETKVG